MVTSAQLSWLNTGILLLSLFSVGFLQATPAPPQQVDVFISGKDGYHTYRIPAVIVSPKGTVLAFCEGRKHSRSDTGDIDLLLKRSLDGGKTWKPAQIVWDDGPNTCGNPCPVVDRATGVIWLLLTHNLGQDHEKDIVAGTSKGTRTAWVCHSEDDGQTWTKPIEITATVKKPEWTWYATGPGVGIQTQKGRLVIPCDYKVGNPVQFYSHVIYSDDHGKSWKLGGIAGPTTGESQVVELADGTLMLNMRNQRGPNARRATAVSNDGGLTWSPISHQADLPEPVCQGSILRYSRGPAPSKDRLLFSNPASETGRVRMTVKVSPDEGKTWPIAKLLHEGPAAYSCLTVLPDQTIGCLYERGDKSAYEKITFARCTLDWLTDGKEK